MKEQKWAGFFTCPVCGKTNIIEGWNLKDGQSVSIVFTASDTQGYKRMTLICECGAQWVLGIKPISNSKNEQIKSSSHE